MSTGAVARKNAAAYTDAAAHLGDAAARTISVDALRG